MVEFLVLLNMSLLAFLSLLSLIEYELLISAVIVLLFELGYSILGHLSLHILALSLTSISMIFQNFTVIFKVRVRNENS